MISPTLQGGSRPTPSEAIAAAVRLYVNSGALDGPPQRLCAIRGLQRAFRLTRRQADALFTRYAFTN